MCNIHNYKKLCLYWLFRFWEKKLSDLRLCAGGSYKHLDKKYDNVLGFGIPDLLMILLSCHGFLKNNDSIVILKCHNSIFEYYFNKGFNIFDCDENNLQRLPYEVKDRVGAEVTDNSDRVMICSTTIPSTSNTHKNLSADLIYHSSYTNK